MHRCFAYYVFVVLSGEPLAQRVPRVRAHVVDRAHKAGAVARGGGGGVDVGVATASGDGGAAGAAAPHLVAICVHARSLAESCSLLYRS